jgi:putative transposase
VSRYQFIDQQRSSYSVRLLCRLLGVTPGCYYAWAAQRASLPISAREVTWKSPLVQVFTRHKQRYGTRQLRAELQAQGYRIRRQRLRTELRRRGLRAVQPRAFTPRTTD